MGQLAYGLTGLRFNCARLSLDAFKRQPQYEACQGSHVDSKLVAGSGAASVTGSLSLYSPRERSRMGMDWILDTQGSRCTVGSLDTLQLLLPYSSSSQAAVSVHHRLQFGFLTHRIPAQPQANGIPCSYWFLTHRHHRQQYLSRQSTTFVGLVADERIPPNG